MPDHPKKISKPHDLFFRKAMGSTKLVEEFIQHYLPANIAKNLDPGSLQLTDGSFIDQDLNEYRTNILYKATFRGKFGYIYFLIEQQTKADRLMPLRMLQYIVQIIDRALEENKKGPLPLVFPCVIHNGKKPYPYETDIFELFEDPNLAREIFLKPFHLIDLPAIPDDDLKKSPLFGMLSLYLKHAYTRDVIGFIKQVADILKQVELSNEIALLEAGAYYLFQTNKEGTSRYDIINEFKTHLNPTTQQEIMTIAEAFISDGLKQGKQQERNQFRSMFLKQLQNRFPNQVTIEHFQRIEKAESDKLFYWIENLLTAKSVEDVFSC